MATATPIDIITSDNDDAPSSSRSAVPMIDIIAGRLDSVIGQAFAVLSRDENIYQRRSGDLVTVAPEPEREEDYEADERVANRIAARPGTPRIVALAAPEVTERLSIAARWRKWDGRAKGAMGERGAMVECDPPERVAIHVATRSRKPGIRLLEAVHEAPFMRPDGSIVQTPGYDPATACVYEPRDVFPVVPSRPSHADAVRALAALREPFADFPFRAGADSYVAPAAILSILARPAICGSVPLFNFDASTRGAGKSLLSDCVSTIATGRAAPRMSWPSNDEELEKVLGAYALQGAAIVVFDNVSRALGGAPLDKVLTAKPESGVQLRILGVSQIPTQAWNAVILTTGNNIMIAGDTERRSLVARIQPGPDCNPEDRTDFKHPDLLAWLRDNRPRLVCAALTLLRAYVVAGRPGALRWGSFEEWAALIASAIVWAGGANVLETRPTVRDGGMTPDTAALSTVLGAWSRIDTTGAGLKLSQVVSMLYTADRIRGEAPPDGFDDIREALEHFAPPSRSGMAPDARALGKALGHYAQRWLDGKCLDNERKGQGGTVRWRVLSAPAPVSAPVEVSPPPAPPAPAVEVSPPEDEPAGGPEDPSDVLAYLDAPAGYEAAYADPCDEYPRE